MVKRIHWSTAAKIVICLLVFSESIQNTIDPDLGWHLRYGQYFFETGHVLRDNILSFVWPWYHWVQASWGYDLFVYQLFGHFGFPGLAIATGGLTMLTFLIVTWPQRRHSPQQLFFLAIIFMTTVTSMWAAGMRTATITTPFMAFALVLSDVILDPGRRRTSVWHCILLPVFFLVWANVHGGFALGLILITIRWIVSISLVIIHKSKAVLAGLPNAALLKKFGLVLAVSWLTPLINPWGLRIYEETFKHTTNVNLNIISEWMPLTTLPVESVITGIYVLFTVIILLRAKKLSSVPLLSMLATATYLAYSANRFLIVLGVLIVYSLSRSLTHIHVPWFKHVSVRIVLWILLVAIVPADMFFFKRYFQRPNQNIFRYNWSDYCTVTENCSEPITEVMRADPPKGNGFHPYNYGGYLIWRVPQVKTFADGRMAAWEENGKTPPALEGDWVFMQNGPVAFTKFDNEYHFTWAIVPTDSGITKYLDDLVQNHLWKRLYKDKEYSYYVKL